MLLELAMRPARPNGVHHRGINHLGRDLVVESSSEDRRTAA